MLTLSAFPVILFALGAVGLYVTRVYTSRHARLSRDLSTIPASERAAVVARELARFGIDASRIGSDQQFQLATETIKHREAGVRLIMQCFVSCIILAASLYVILSGSFSPQDKHWAFGSVGTVIGFWLKG